MFLPCGFFFLLPFFPRPISAVADGCLLYFHTWCALVKIYDAGLQRAARGSLKNTGRKKVAKNRHLGSGHHRTTLSGYIFATKARIDNRKKNLLSSNTSSIRPHNMANFGPLTAEIG